MNLIGDQNDVHNLSIYFVHFAFLVVYVTTCVSFYDFANVGEIYNARLDPYQSPTTEHIYMSRLGHSWDF